MSFIDSAFMWGLGFGAAGCGGLATMAAGAYALDVIALRRKKRATASEQRPKSAIEDLVRWKRQRRLEEADTWQEAFNALDPLRRARGGYIQPVRRGYTKGDLRMLSDNYGTRRGRELYLRGWDGLHHATCPYECDCPQDVRSTLFHRNVS